MINKLVLTLIIAALVFSLTNVHAIEPYSQNNMYWEYKGKPILLFGASDRDNLFQWTGSKLADHLDLLKNSGGNYLRCTISSREYTKAGYRWDLLPYPYAKTGGKYDLNTWNSTYWNNFKNFLTQTKNRDIIVQVEVWDRWNEDAGWAWSPWNPDNNINYTYSETKNLVIDPPFYNAFHYAYMDNDNILLSVQKKFIRKIVDTVVDNGFDHVLFQVDNESGIGKSSFGGDNRIQPDIYWADFIINYAASKGKSAYVSISRRFHSPDPYITTSFQNLNNPSISVPAKRTHAGCYLDISQNNGNVGQSQYDNLIWFRNLVIQYKKRPINNVKCYHFNWPTGTSFHSRTAPSDREAGSKFWRVVFGGAASIRFHRHTPTQPGGLREGFGLTPEGQIHIRSMRKFVDEINIFKMEPRNDLLSSRANNEAYCLAENGIQYAVFFTGDSDRSVSLNLSGTSGTFTTRWLDVANSSWGSTGSISGGATRTITAPGSGHRIIVIKSGSIPKTTLAEDLLYRPVTPCRLVDTRKTSAGMIGAYTQRDFYVYGSGGTIRAQGGNPSGCPSPLGEPLAAHINMIAVNPTGKGNLQAFPVGARTGAGLSVNYNTIDTNLANAGTVKTITGSGPEITVASNFSSAHTVIDVLGYYYPDEGFYYTPVDPCRIVDTRKTSAGIIGASTQRDFHVSGPVSDQGGNPDGCPSTLGVSPEAVHLNMIAVDPTGKGNLQAFSANAGPGASVSVNYNTIDTNLANAGTVKAITGTGPNISVASNFSSAHTVIDVLGYYSEKEDLLYTPVTPCRIVDTRNTSAGIIVANTQRDFRVSGPVSDQGGDSDGCPSPGGEPLAAHINVIAVNPTGKGNLQVFPVASGKGAGLSVNYNTIDTNLANAGTVETSPDITVASNFSSAHTVIDVLGYYYPAP